MSAKNTTSMHYLQEAIVGITLSAVALSLGGAFGLLSGRGVLAGMLSAAVYPLITSALGGTRIQCSGPTGPMTTMFIAVLASATEQMPGFDEVAMSSFLNMTIFLMAALLLVGGVLRLGNWVKLVPNVVISGFMNGIALIIWLSQCKKLLQLSSSPITGSILLNCSVALSTLIIALGISSLTKHATSRLASLLSGTLVALVVVTAVCTALDLPLDRSVPSVPLHSLQDFSALLATHSPTNWPWHLLLTALPLALQLAGVAYLDTLLTSLIIDRQTGTSSKKNQELGAQGIATGMVALLGGIPGAQATERSVLMLKEGAQTRLAGVLIGVFSLVGVLLLQDVVALIPKAVFAGILLKVGYDVFDWQPLLLYRKRAVVHEEMLIIVVTAAITAFVNLMVAVVVGTVLFMLMQKTKRGGLPDLQLLTETEGLTDEP